MINRELGAQILNNSHKGKAIILTGPRQVGKTTLTKSVLKNKKVLRFNGDNAEDIEQLQPRLSYLKQLIGKNDFLYIDEAQRIPNIGVIAKLIIDELPGIQVILTGSSSFDLNSQINEPLTGRKFELNLFPISWKEWSEHKGFAEASKSLEQHLIYGMYPEILTHPNEQELLLQELANSYLYKDILALSNVQKADELQRLTQALAFQIGSEVSYSELAKHLRLTKDTVQRYIDVLEKGFVVYRLGSYSRNLRNEIKFGKKIYFYDNGVRNAVIRNFAPPHLRNDMGALWENWLITERLKRITYNKKPTELYFWRTRTQKEIDLVEVTNGSVTATEIKWKQKRVKPPHDFIETYNADYNVVDKNNFWEFID